jgi:tetratricopeptide (TPR) repeat protein
MPVRLKRWFFNQMAAWCMLFRQRDQALAWYQKMLALDPDDALAMASIAPSAQQGRNREALAMFDRVLR